MHRQISTTLLAALLAILLANFLTSFVGAGDVYKEIDAQGNVVYSDRPRDAAAKRLDVDSSKTDPAAIAARREALDKSRENRKEAQVKAAANSERKRDLAAQRKANCEKARAYQQRVETAHRLYDVDADGNRNYYSAAQHDAALAKASKQIKEWCDTDRS